MLLSARMNERLTNAPGESPRAPEPTERLARGRRIGAGAFIAVTLASGIITWVVVRHSSSSSPSAPVATPIAPVALSASGLQTLARTVGQPIYWAGPRRNYLYELKRTSDNKVFIRYLPPGVDAGVSSSNYMIVATYPFIGAFAALKRVAGGRGIQLPGGGLAVVDEKHPTSIHLAFPSIPYQVEVYDPSPVRALAVASSGAIQLAQ
jgi:hypothetical protein